MRPMRFVLSLVFLCLFATNAMAWGMHFYPATDGQYTTCDTDGTGGEPYAEALEIADTSYVTCDTMEVADVYMDELDEGDTIDYIDAVIRVKVECSGSGYAYVMLAINRSVVNGYETETLIQEYQTPASGWDNWYTDDLYYDVFLGSGRDWAEADLNDYWWTVGCLASSGCDCTFDYINATVTYDD